MIVIMAVASTDNVVNGEAKAYGNKDCVHGVALGALHPATCSRV